MSLLLNLSALFALLPVGLLVLHAGEGVRTPVPGRLSGSSPARPWTREESLFWALLAVAVAGPLLYVSVALGTSWRSDLAMALWLAVSATLLVFPPLCLLWPAARGLTVLLVPYLFLMALGASIAGAVEPSVTISADLPGGWFSAHIVVALATYALLTLAAITALAVFVKERGLKRKKMRGGIAVLLPSIADCEKLQNQLLGGAVIVLAGGLATGFALQLYRSSHRLELDHKSILSIVTFGVLMVLWVVHGRFGMRGRTVSRLLLVAYLLLTLAYPGVKFVAGILV